MSGNRIAIVAVLSSVLASLGLAVEFEVHVKSGETALRNAPIRVPVDFAPQAVSLSGAGFMGMGQVTPVSLSSQDDTESELCFVIPYLPPNEKLTIFGKRLQTKK